MIININIITIIVIICLQPCIIISTIIYYRKWYHIILYCYGYY